MTAPEKLNAAQLSGPKSRKKVAQGESPGTGKRPLTRPSATLSSRGEGEGEEGGNTVPGLRHGLRRCAPAGLIGGMKRCMPENPRALQAGHRRL